MQYFKSDNNPTKAENRQKPPIGLRHSDNIPHPEAGLFTKCVLVQLKLT